MKNVPAGLHYISESVVKASTVYQKYKTKTMEDKAASQQVSAA